MKKDFRKYIKNWIKENCPEEMKTPVKSEDQVWASSKISFPNADAKQWFEAMVSEGYCTPTWPKQYGGAGLSDEDANILKEELKLAGCRNPQINFGITMLGPVILEYGTEEQRQEFLPKISKGEIRWCQGFSEPGAGSDLAGISTQALKNGNNYLINGSKIWTSEADKSDWMYCLTKTDKTKKHDGISFLLLNMRQKGVTTKKIRLLSGVSPFCQVFFDDAIASVNHCIGGENQGWKVAKKLLLHERLMMSDMESEGAFDIAPNEILSSGSDFEGKSLMHKEINKHELRNNLIDLTMQRVKQESLSSFSEASLTLKYLSTEELQKRWELNINALGMGGLINVDQEDNQLNNIVKSFFYSKAYTIAGGSSEVQLNIISKNLLGLKS